MKFARLLTPWPLCISIVVLAAVIYFTFTSFYVYTSDAYFEANVININPHVAGYVKTVNVVENQRVTKGQLLFQIDPTPFNDAVAYAQGQLKGAEEDYASLLAQEHTTRALIATYKANAAWYASEEKRIAPLVKKGFVSQEKGSQIYFALQQANAELQQSEWKLKELQAKLGNGPDDFSELAIAKANLKTALLNLSYTTVTSPVNGRVVAFLLRPGQYVTVGENLFAVIDEQNTWIVARFKETSLDKIKVGASVDVYFDMYKFHKFKAQVESIGWGVNRDQASNAVTNSALPYLEQTEYWVRLAQRFPVRIKIDDTDPRYPLRVGASARVLVKR